MHHCISGHEVKVNAIFQEQPYRKPTVIDNSTWLVWQSGSIGIKLQNSQTSQEVHKNLYDFLEVALINIISTSSWRHGWIRNQGIIQHGCGYSQYKSQENLAHQLARIEDDKDAPMPRRKKPKSHFNPHHVLIVLLFFFLTWELIALSARRFTKSEWNLFHVLFTAIAKAILSIFA